MTFTRDNLTAKQKDYAVFLPALSGFYSTYVGKQRHDPTYVDPARIPADFETGIEGLNWLNAEDGYFPYKWALYSAGHAELDVNKFAPGEDMVRNRDRNTTFVLGDSGGFQIGKGVWEGNWKDPNCPKAKKKRELVLSWMDAYMDRGMILDIPAWVARSPAGAKATGISTYDEAVRATEINNDYFMQKRNGNCKFLNVLQGEIHSDADKWYHRMKHYCDPKKHDQPFEGWAMGGQNMCDIHLILRRLVDMRYDGLLEKGLHDWMHFLGTSKLEWALLLTDIQRAVRKYHNENFTVSFDCASPFLATANGQVYTNNDYTDREKWSYRMQKSVDDKKYATDTRRFADAVVQDRVFQVFEDSPVSERTLIKDICIYGAGTPKPGVTDPDPYNAADWLVLPDYNKLGKVSNRTSWDSFSYAIQMGHNVHRHITAVQTANSNYDSGTCPKMLAPNDLTQVHFRQVINDIFSANDRGTAEKIVNDYQRYLDATLIGTRGATGKRLLSGKAMFETLFEEEAPAISEEEHHIDDSGFDEANLDQLEMEQK
jgi:hypothetical protein